MTAAKTTTKTPVGNIPKWAIDLFDRTASTFAQAFLGVYLVKHGNMSELTALEAAAAAGGLAVGKFLLAKAAVYNAAKEK